MIVTIDGPAGSGKSTVARRLAERLGFHFLDTGATYRCVGWRCLTDGVDLTDHAAVAATARALAIRFDSDRVFADDVDVTAAIRTPEVSEAASVVAVVPDVRRALVRLQRESVRGQDVVSEGRDQGTVVFPDAEHKFFLTADPRERARRRLQELAEQGVTLTEAEVHAQMLERDERDARRDLAPLVPAADAVVVDTTTMSLDDAVNLLERHVRG
jgi:cytidylate kinase